MTKTPSRSKTRYHKKIAPGSIVARTLSVRIFIPAAFVQKIHGETARPTTKNHSGSTIYNDKPTQSQV